MTDLIILTSSKTEQGWVWGLSDGKNWGQAVSDEDKTALIDLGFSRLMAVVPGTEIVTKLHTLEGLNEKQRLQAVGFSVEDELAAPLDRTHLAFDTESSNIAICSSALLDNLLSEFAGFGLSPDTICADYDSFDEAISLVYGGRLITRTGTGLGHAIETDMASLVLEKGQQLPPFITPEQFLDRIVQARTAGHQPINLRQGNYAKKIQFGSGRFSRIAMLAAAIAIAFLGLNLGQGLYYGSQTKSVKQEIGALYAEIFPGTDIPPNPVIPVVRAQADLNRPTGTDFVSLSALLAQSIREVDGVEIASLRYDKGRAQINLSILYGSFEDAERLKAAVAKNGGVFTEGGTRQSGDGLTGDATFRGGA